MSTVIECEGAGQAWSYLLQDSNGNSVDPRTDNDTKTKTTTQLPGCPVCLLTAKDLKIKVSRKNGKLSPIHIPEHMVEVPGDELLFMLINGEFDVHVKGCNRIKAQLKKSDYERPGTVLATDPHDLVTQLWDDIIPEAWVQEEDPEGTPEVRDPETDELLSPINPTDEWLEKHNYYSATGIHTCVAKLGGEWANGTGAKGKAKSNGGASRQAKRDLALVLVEAMAQAIKELQDDPANDPNKIIPTLGYEEARQVVAQWIHHFPANRDEWINHLPRPNRSDWITESEAAGTQTSDETDDDTNSDADATDEDELDENQNDEDTDQEDEDDAEE